MMSLRWTVSFLFLWSIILIHTTKVFTKETPTTATAGHQFLNFENESLNDSASSHRESRYHVFSVDFMHVEAPYIIVVWVVCASFAKIGFHLNNKLSSIFPESCMLIILGVIVGGILFATKTDSVNYTLNSNTFFYYLLPPIVLEAGYFMPNRAFFDNIGTILLFAVVGTLFNTFTIGSSLFGLSIAGSWMNIEVSFIHCLVFSSLISAVDPVAVLAVFEEIHVNEVLHIIIFGESLLNDAVTVVLYHTFEAYSEIGEENIIVYDVLAGMLSFFIVGIGGTVIGVLFGLATAFITKYTDHVRVIEPLFVFAMSYLSYLSAEIFHFSGIMAITFCGITMKNYVEHNISQKSHTTIKYFMKMLSSVSETIIFMFLGTSTVVDTHEWNIGFICFTLLFCLLFRAIGVVTLSWAANRNRLIKLTKVDQFVMAYGGIRGAIAFSLVTLLKSDIIPAKNVFRTTTLIVVFFTVFIQGITIKPLVNILKVKKQEKFKPSMNEHLNERLLDHLMAGIEDVTGFHGHHWLRDKFEYYDTRYLKRYLLRERLKTREHSLFTVNSKLMLKDAMDHIATHGSFSNLNHLKTDASLANIIRNWSHSSLFNGSHHSEASEADKVCPNGTVIDMQAIEAHYCKKIADDTKIHHILSDNMIKPRKRWTKHRKHQLHDVENHAPFHHHARHNLRHLISNKARHHTEKVQEQRNGRKKSGGLPKNVSFADDLQEEEKSTKKPVRFSVVNEEGGNNSDSDSDEYITFSAQSPTDEVDTSSGFNNTTDPDNPAESGHLLPPRTPTAAELTLPWKRDTGRPALSSSATHLMPDDDCKPSLSQCPSWVDNMEYSPEVIFDSQENILIKREDKKFELANDNETFEEYTSSIPPPWRRSSGDDAPIRSPSASNELDSTEVEPARSSSISFPLSDFDNHAVEHKQMEEQIRSHRMMGDIKEDGNNVGSKIPDIEHHDPEDRIHKWLEDSKPHVEQTDEVTNVTEADFKSGDKNEITSETYV